MIIAGNHRTKTPGIAVAALIADTTKSDGECELRIWEVLDKRIQLPPA